MADSNVQVVERLFEAFSRNRLEGAIDLLAEDFVVVVPPSMSAEPDTYEGHAGVRRYMAAFDGAVDDVRFRVHELREAGDRVLARMEITGRGAASGLPVQIQSVAVVWIRAGKVTRIDPYPDLETAQRALGER